MSDDKKTRRKRWLFRLIALAISGGLSLLLAEVLLRVADPRGISAQVHNAGFLLYGLEPGGHPLVYRQGIARRAVMGYHLNNYGFRGPDFKIEKTPGVRRIVVIGDSLAFGSGCRIDKVWTSVLEADLRARSRTKLEIYNISVPGYNAVGELGLLVHRALPLRPDLVVLLAVSNDDTIQPGNQEMYELFPSLRDGEIENAARPQTFPRDTWIYPVWKLANSTVPYCANFAYIYVLGQGRVVRGGPASGGSGSGSAAAAVPTTLAAGGSIGRVDMYNAHRAFYQSCKDRGVPVLTLYLGKQSEPLARYTAAAAELHGVPLRYLPKSRKLGAEYRNSPSDGHYNEKGNRALADEILEVARDLLH